MNEAQETICGIDEAGRGTLAGSLFVAGVILKHPILGLKDSKKLSPKRRFELYDSIVAHSLYHVVSFDSEQIDSLGLSHCLREAIIQIKTQLQADQYIMDGNTTFGIPGIEALIKGDDLIPAISAASILAKVSKDREMVHYDALYPEYGFAQHKGYGTAEHIQKICELGMTRIHRKSFKIRQKLF